MRIAYVCAAYRPAITGGAVVVQSLAEGMTHRGHTVLVLTASETGRPHARSDGRLRLSRLASVRNPFRVGQRLMFLPRSAVLRELRSFRPHIVHVHDPLGLGVASIRLARPLGVPVILTVHALPWLIAAHVPDYPGLRTAVEEVMWSYARWVADQCDTLVAPTGPISRELHAQLGHRPQTISSGVAPSLFTPQPTSPAESSDLCRQFGLDPARPVILYVGRIDPDKRVEEVVEAAGRVLDATRAQLLIVGDGSRRPAVERLCEELGIAEQTRFTGYIPHDAQLPGLYRLASALVTLSRIETQCLVVLEALLSGLPVVTVDTAVMRLLVRDGVNGFLVPPDDPGTTAHRLVRLLENPEVARRMGRAGRALAQHHSPERMLDRHEQLYLSVLRRYRRGTAPQLARDAGLLRARDAALRHARDATAAANQGGRA